MEPIHAVHSRRTSVNAQDQWVFLGRIPANGFDQESVDLPIVGAPVGNALDGGSFTILPEGRVGIREAALALSFKIGNKDVVEMTEIVYQVSHSPSAR